MPDAQGLLSQDSFLEVTFEDTISVSFDETYNTIERATGSFITDGYVAGMRVETDSVDNPGPFIITSVAALALTIDASTPVVDEVAGSQVLTVFVKVAEVISLNTPAGEPSEIDMTHLRSASREFRNGLRDEGSISGEMNFVPSDKGQQILAEMQGEKIARTVRITVPPVEEDQNSLDGYQWTFQGLARGQPVSLGVDEKAVRAFTIRVSGAVTEEIIEAA